MGLNKKLKVEVAYAKADEQCVMKVVVGMGTTVEEVIQASGVLKLYPEIDLRVQKVGVFGKSRELKDLVKEGDRVEIYRGLLIDPKEARRQRVKK